MKILKLVFVFIPFHILSSAQNSELYRYTMVINSVSHDKEIIKIIRKNITKRKKILKNNCLQISVANEIIPFRTYVSSFLKDNKEFPDSIFSQIPRDDLIKLYDGQKTPVEILKIDSFSTNLDSHLKIFFSKSIQNTLVCEISYFVEKDYRGYNSTIKKLNSIFLIYFFDENNEIIFRNFYIFQRSPHVIFL